MSKAWGPPSAPGNSRRGWDRLMSNLGVYKDSRAVARTKGQGPAQCPSTGSWAHGKICHHSGSLCQLQVGSSLHPVPGLLPTVLGGSRGAPGLGPACPLQGQPRSSPEPETPFSCPWAAVWGSRQEKPPHGY